MSLYLTGIDINVADAGGRHYGSGVPRSQIPRLTVIGAGTQVSMAACTIGSSPVAWEGGSARREICLIKWQVKGRSRARQ